MLLQVIWSPWVGALAVVDPNLVATPIVISKINHPFEGASLRVLYLANRIRCQLLGKDAPQVLMEPLVFMLTLLSIMDVIYQL